MPSYTSNSNERIPNLNYKSLWLSAMVLLLFSVLTWNFYWINKGYLPLPSDDAKLWAYTRRKVPKQSKNTVVLIGASRIRLDINSEVFYRETGVKLIQLAIYGESSIPVLQNFAEDETFTGTIISDFGESLLYNIETQRTAQNKFKVDEWVKFYNNDKSTNDLEFFLKTLSAYLIIDPQLGNSVPDKIYNLSFGKISESTKLNPTHFDRSSSLDYSRLTKEQIHKMRTGPIKELKRQSESSPPQPEKFLNIINKIEKNVQRIQARGGKVIFVYMPSSGELWKLNNQVFPREKYWNVFAEKTSARTIHFEDYPTLAHFKAPDGSHLSAEDATLFTKELVKIIYNKSDTKVK